METHMLWTPLQQAGLEHLHLIENETGASADGLVLGIERAIPFRLHYQIRMDSTWHVRECHLQAEKSLHLYADGQGHWTDDTGTALPELDGCLDIDISRTPFTNTLPIRRLGLAAGEQAKILVVYITAPDLSIRPFPQRYTCLTRTDTDAIYRYESLEGTFTADLPVNSQGLVIDYPKGWKRVEIPVA